MIGLRSRADCFEVFPKDSDGTLLLERPLHRLFLRGQMGAELMDEGVWKIDWGTDKGGQLEKLFQHLSRYKISYALDSACQEIVREISKYRSEFKEYTKAGLKARSALPDDYRKDLQRSLSKSFKRKLTDRQLHAVHHLLSVHNGADFSVPGSGKTSIVLAYYLLLKQSQTVDAILVVGPASCFGPWEQEYQLCFGEPAQSIRIAGNPRETRRDMYFAVRRYDLVLTTYHTATKDIRDTARMLSRRKYLMVLDESHHIKRPQGGKLADAMLSLSDYAERRVILTGTPMPNGLPDLWSQFTFLWKRVLPLGEAQAYLDRIQAEETESAAIQVRRQVYPLFFRITKSQLGLPRPTFAIVKCELSDLQARIYRGIAARFLTQLREAPGDRDTLRKWRRARAVRLLQVAVNPTLLVNRCDEFNIPPMRFADLTLKTLIEGYPKYEMPEKFLKCCELARSIVASRKKVVIWSTFVHNLTMLDKHLNDLGTAVIHGGVPYAKVDEEELTREEIIARFKNDSNCQVLIANPAACAESISLHKVCRDAIYLDRSFNCAHYMQSLDRIHRLGLGPKDKVIYHILECRGTIDEIVGERLSEKMRTMRQVIEASLPGTIDGFWDAGIDGMDDSDLDQVEKHIRNIGRS